MRIPYFQQRLPRIEFVAISVSCIFLASCVPPQAPTPSRLTHGQAQVSLHKGKTTQTEVLEAFGSPNITSLDSSSCEVWTYQRHGSSSTSSSAYGTAILFGGAVGGFESSSRSMTLIIKFDSKKVVRDFDSIYSSF